MNNQMTKAEEFISCVSTNNMPYAKLMLSNGEVNINSNSFDNSKSLLIEAASRGRHDFVTWAIENGADINFGRIPAVHRAAQNGHMDCVLRLVEAGAYVGPVDVFYSAGLYALGNGFVDIYRFLDNLYPEETFKSAASAYFLPNEHVRITGNLIALDDTDGYYLSQLKGAAVIFMIENGMPKKSVFPTTEIKKESRERIAKSLYALPQREKDFLVSIWQLQL